MIRTQPISVLNSFLLYQNKPCYLENRVIQSTVLLENRISCLYYLNQKYYPEINKHLLKRHYQNKNAAFKIISPHCKPFCLFGEPHYHLISILICRTFIVRINANYAVRCAELWRIFGKQRHIVQFKIYMYIYIYMWQLV